MQMLKILGLHVLLNFVVLVGWGILTYFFHNPLVQDYLPAAYASIILPIAYGYVGYTYITRDLTEWEKGLSFSIVSVVGVAIWAFSFYDYIRIHPETTGFIDFPDEFVWVFFGMYNLYAMLISQSDLVHLFGDPVRKYALSIVMLAVNTWPMLFMAFGYWLKTRHRKEMDFLI